MFAAHRRRRRRHSSKQRAAQNRMSRASKKCKGRSKREFRACVRRELKK